MLALVAWHPKRVDPMEIEGIWIRSILEREREPKAILNLGEREKRLPNKYKLKSQRYS